MEKKKEKRKRIKKNEKRKREKGANVHRINFHPFQTRSNTLHYERQEESPPTKSPLTPGAIIFDTSS